MKTVNLNLRVEPILVQEMELYIKKQSNSINAINSKSELVRRAVIKYIKENDLEAKIYDK
jgi:metal-responsive CopG/Arc/MetJ family transcriptional regulator